MSEHTPTKTPTRRRRTPTEVAGHRLLRPLEGSHATWEIPSDDKRRMRLLVLGRARKGQERAARTAFHRQLRARTSLRHPHLAPIEGGGESPRGPYIVVSLPRARTLSSLIHDQEQLDPGQAYRLLSGVADALDAAHTRWLIHTDLTPRAIFVEPGDRDWAWLTDFGIAHNRPPLAFARAGYRSPEELRGEAPLPESNVYSLACIVYTCLSGSAPFARQSSRAAMQAQLNEPPPKLSEERPELPKAIDAVLLKALSKKPEDRQATPGELIREVGAALGVLEPEAPKQPTGRFRRRTAVNGAALAPAKPATNGAAPAAAPAQPEAAPAAPARRRTTPIETLPPRKRARGGGAPRAMLIPLLLVAIGGAGAAGWVLGGAESDEPAPGPDPAAQRAARIAAAEADAATAAEKTRLDWLASANQSVETLRSRRASDRRRLADARLPAGQADRARAISRSYARARAALADAPDSVAAAAAVRSALRRAERAYTRLARSAGNENRSAYRRSVDSVRASEADLSRALARLGEPPKS
jgi:serine/threonine-protein kinase